MSTDGDTVFLQTFHGYLKTLGEDARALSSVVESGSEPERRFAISALTYLFKSLDLIPDGIDDIGYCDDAFVFRVAMAQAVEAGAASSDVAKRLAQESDTVRAFLGDVYPMLDTYVRTLARSAARGRTVDDVLAYEDIRTIFVSEVRAWAGDYECPAFAGDEKTAARLRAFLRAKLA
jgi:uncharacterized membrane protein YkvA (DUF1232 family)